MLLPRKKFLYHYKNVRWARGRHETYLCFVVKRRVGPDTLTFDFGHLRNRNGCHVEVSSAGYGEDAHERTTWADSRFACLRPESSCFSCVTWGPCARVCGVMEVPERRGLVTPSPGSAPGLRVSTAPSRSPSSSGTCLTFAWGSLFLASTSVTWRTALKGKAWGCWPRLAWGSQWWATKVRVCRWVCQQQKLHWWIYLIFFPDFFYCWQTFVDCKKSNFKAWEELHQNSVRLTRKLNRILQVVNLKLLFLNSFLKQNSLLMDYDIV